MFAIAVASIGIPQSVSVPLQSRLQTALDEFDMRMMYCVADELRALMTQKQERCRDTRRGQQIRRLKIRMRASEPPARRFRMSAIVLCSLFVFVFLILLPLTLQDGKVA